MANYDDAMMRVMTHALDRIYRAEHREDVARRPAPSRHWQGRLNGYTPEKRRSIIAEWVRAQDDPDGWIGDALTTLDLPALLAAYEQGDETEIGRRIVRALDEYLTRPCFSDDEHWKLYD
jgi:hypothetical protein